MLPDPGFLYLSKKHQTALTMLEYALYNNAGFCVITGEIGAGKTTLLRKLLENMEDHISVGMITNTHESFGELLDWVLSAFNIHKPGLNKVEMHQVFLEYLLQQYAKKKTVLLIVDEAQNMNAETLEELRMLSNINSGKDQLLQVILSGQPELKDTLRKPELRQFVQRIAVDYHLGPLSIEETFGYIRHRLMTAGATRDVFTPLACERIHAYSGGIPRLINLICDTAMVYGFADQAKLISESLVEEMIRERMTDSLVPISKPVRNTTAAESLSPAGTENNAGRTTSTAAPRLSQVSNDHSKQTEPQVAEKKTAIDSRSPVAIHPQAQISGQHAARLKSVTALPEPEQQAEPVQLNPPLSQPELSAEPVAENMPEPVSEKPGDSIDPASARDTDRDGNAGQNRMNTVVASQAGEAKRSPRLENRIEVRNTVAVEPEAKSAWPGKWPLYVLLAIGAIVAVVVFGRGMFHSETSRPAKTSVREVAPAPVSESKPVAAPDTQQQAADEAARREQEQREEQERQQRAEEAARAQQQQEAEAAAAAAAAREEQEKKQREKEAAAAAAAKKAERARLAAERAKLEEAKARAAELEAKLKAEQEARLAAEAEAARQLRLEQELKSAIQEEVRRASELERKEQENRAQEQAAVSAPAPVAPAPAADSRTTDPELEFTTDPCAGPSARFLSTCRK